MSPAVNPRRSPRLARLALGLLVCARAGVAAQDAATGPAGQPGRPDASRTAEPAAVSRLQQQLDAVSPTLDSCETAYVAHKAQAWVNFGKYAAAEQLPAAVQSAALAQGAALVAALAQGRRASHDTAELPHARHVRDDLWRGVAAAEADGRACAAPKMTAYCEVQLAWAGYEAGAGGWRHADPYLRIAEDYCLTAMAAEAPARAPTAAVTAAVPSPAPSPAPEPAPSPAPEPDLSVLFTHDHAAARDIRAPGMAELAQLAQRWQAGPHGKIQVVGHADLTGHGKYNQRLSARRARTVARELVRLGVPAAAIETQAAGSTQELVACRRPGEAVERRRYLACLEPNRRVVVHIDGP